jgi:hypothetical protein
MQPITQASLDPSRDDSRPLQAEQEFCGAVGFFDLILLKAQVNPPAALQPTLPTGSVPQFNDPIGIRHQIGNVATCRHSVGFRLTELDVEYSDLLTLCKL